MAAAVVPISDASPNGVLDLVAIETAMDATDGAKFLNDGKTRILVRNAGAGPHVITAVTPKTVAGGLAVADKTFSVATGDWAALPYLDPTYFNDNDGYCTLTADGTKTEVKVVSIRD